MLASSVTKKLHGMLTVVLLLLVGGYAAYYSFFNSPASRYLCE